MSNKTQALFIALLLYIPLTSATEYKLQGIVDIRASSTNSLPESYLSAGQGKFAQSNGQQLSLAQGGAEMSVSWESGISAHGIINAYINDETHNNRALGFTETYLKYRSLPNSAGYRLQIKTGIFYPEISLENTTYAWASKDTLNSSMINTWIGEEIRVLGAEFKTIRLGRINNNNFDLSLSSTLFINNDPAGALLAWHGWTMSSRQTLWTEKNALPWFPARATGNGLATQAPESDPFLELDDNLGYHLRAAWKLHNKGKIAVGYYDNNATSFVVENGQYGWHTRFYHLGLQWRLANNLYLTSQYLTGSTLMKNDQQQDVVNNDYQSVFVALTYRWSKLLNNKHKSTLRLEHFSVTDNDDTEGDDNNEDGQALTINHTYRLAKQWFLSSEFSLIDSYRPARAYENQDIDLIETQLQLAARYFF